MTTVSRALHGGLPAPPQPTSPPPAAQIQQPVRARFAANKDLEAEMDRLHRTLQSLQVTNDHFVALVQQNRNSSGSDDASSSDAASPPGNKRRIGDMQDVDAGREKQPVYRAGGGAAADAAWGGSAGGGGGIVVVDDCDDDDIYEQEYDDGDGSGVTYRSCLGADCGLEPEEDDLAAAAAAGESFTLASGKLVDAFVLRHMIDQLVAAAATPGISAATPAVATQLRSLEGLMA